MADDTPDLAQQSREAAAVVTILARLAGFSELPLLEPGSEPVHLADLPDAIETLRVGTLLPAPQRLELLARLVKHRALNGLAHLELEPLASTLVRSDIRSEAADVTTELMERLAHWTEGTEPLTRTLDTLHDPDELTRALSDDIQCTALTIQSGCDTAAVTVDGTPALSVVTEAYTCRTFDTFGPLVDPLRWPDCWLQHAFFRSMQPLAPPSTPTPAPDGGWRQTLLETVDFGLGMTGDHKQEVATELEFTYFWNDAVDPATLGAGTSPLGGLGSAPSVTSGPQVVRSPTAAAGCTYDLKHSDGGRILVDQGFLLVEDLPGSGYRRYRTQKEIWFASGNPVPDGVCPIWSVASGLILQGC